MLGELFKSGPKTNGSEPTLDELEGRIDPARLPKHIAVIMDGNGRWAKRRAMPRLAGHRAGITSLREMTRNCADLGIKVLTVYAFSTENWQRPREEVNFLLNLFDEVLDRELEELHGNGVQVRLIGRQAALPRALADKARRAEEYTAANDRLILNVGFNYGGRAEIVDAAKALVARAREGELTEDDVDESLLARSMYTGDLPDPDLLIRTGGESRVSNFLLWQMAYAEFWVTPLCWPDFRRIHLVEALLDYQERDRRFGRV